MAFVQPLFPERVRKPGLMDELRSSLTAESSSDQMQRGHHPFQMLLCASSQPLQTDDSLFLLRGSEGSYYVSKRAGFKPSLAA